MYTDFIYNGQANGEFGSALSDARFDTGLMRPFIGNDGKRYCKVKTGKKVLNTETNQFEAEEDIIPIKDLIDNGIPVQNATLGLRHDEWRAMDQAVLDAARQPLQVWTDLRSSNTYGGFDGMSSLVLEHEVMSDGGEAIEDMDALTDGRTDEPKNQLRALPLPITHSDFYFSERKLAISRKTGSPLDLTQAEQAGRRIAERIEQVTLGVATGFALGADATRYDMTPQVWGYANHPHRNTKTDMTAPTSANGTTVVGEVLEMIELARVAGFYGPFMLYAGRGYDAQLDNDLKVNSSITTRQRLREIQDVRDVRSARWLTGDQLLLVQMSSNVARAVVGMDIRTVMWESSGGLRKNFKVMGILVPQIRSDFNNKTGIVHGTTS